MCLRALPSADCTVKRAWPIVHQADYQEGYDGQAYTAIKIIGAIIRNAGGKFMMPMIDSFYEEFYTWPHPTLYIPKT